ncbi:hypothetical protein [Jatrophihabitans sp.]|uniref:hypothetical protein n=1 Tax=Jatrophihabitans sp. TaxID=1932789 RepID=UPI0030C74D6C|nr:hypothetical protein [Jatrophihabitans sp.]
MAVHILRATGFVGLAAVTALCVGCSSSSGGKPATGSSSTSSSPSGSISTPSIGTPSVGGDQAGSDFCKGFDPAKIASYSNFSDPKSAVTLWDHIAATAPSAIKSQATEVDEFLKKAVAGTVTSAPPASLGQDAVAVVTYAAAHCVAGS